LASLCAAAALVGTWTAAQAVVLAPVDSFSITRNLPNGTDTLYNARLLYFGYTSHSTFPHLTQAALPPVIVNGTYQVSIQRPIDNFFFTWGFGLVGSYVPTQADLLVLGQPSETGMIVGNGTSPALGTSFLTQFGLAEYPTAFDILASQDVTTANLVSFFTAVGTGAGQLNATGSFPSFGPPNVDPAISIPLFQYSDAAAFGSFSISPAAVPEAGAWGAIGIAGLVAGQWWSRRRA